MSKYSSKNAAFQFGLLLFMVAGLSFGIILTTGKASLNLFSFAQQVQTNYSIAGRACYKAGDACINGSIWDCVGGVYILKNDCVKEGYVGCLGSSGNLGPSCVYNLPNNKCSGSSQFCKDGDIYNCYGGFASPAVDCKSQSKMCGVSNGKIGCYMLYPVNTTTCRNGNIYDCKAGKVCTVKHVCQNGCYPDDGEVPRVYDSPSCVSVKNTRFNKCSVDNKYVLYCDGTYCTRIADNCAKKNMICQGTGSDTKCDVAPSR